MESRSTARVEGAGIFAGEPYGHYRQLRARGPIAWADDLFGGAWLLTTFEGVQAALKDPRLSAHRTGGWVMREALRGSPERRQLTEMQRLFARAMLFVDKPAHPRLRAAMQRGFVPERIQALRPVVAALVDGLIARIDAVFDAAAPFDFIEHFARPLPAQVIARLLGLRSVGGETFLAWSTDLAAFLGAVSPSVAQALAARASVLGMGEAIAGCMARGDLDDDGLVARLAGARERGEIESAAEMLAQCVMLLFAGHETTRHFLGTAVYWLLREPGAWRSLQDPLRLKSAVRELLRWDSPVQYTGRRANGDFELFGAPVRRGDLVLPLIGAANRDPGRYAEPDTLDLDRAVGLPLSFGSGPHVCIGASLTLMEAECALEALVRRWPDLRLHGDAPPWLAAPLYRGLVSLPLGRAAGRERREAGASEAGAR